MRPTTRTARWESISVAATSQATERSAVRPGGREDHVGVKPKRSRPATVDIEHVRVVSIAWLSGCVTVGNDHYLTTIRRPARFLLDSWPCRNRAYAGAIGLHQVDIRVVSRGAASEGDHGAVGGPRRVGITARLAVGELHRRR